jgi:hypothetical protein
MIRQQFFAADDEHAARAPTQLAALLACRVSRWPKVSSDRPTISERYSVACRSSDLRVAAHCGGDVEVIGAAGWTRQRNNLGALLLRLHGEFDAVRLQIMAAQRWATRQRHAASKLRHSPELAAELDRQATAGLQSELALTMAQIKSLRPSRDALRGFAIVAATKRRLMLPDAQVCELADAVLEWHINPQCPSCGGRGKVGVLYRGEAQSVCRACNGIGRRSARIGRTEPERWFASWLLAEIDLVIARAATRLRRHMAAR